MTYSWFDSHCHLDMLSEQQITQSINKNVTHFIIPSVNANTKKASEISNKFANTYFTVGLHPLFLPENLSDNVFEQIEITLKNSEKCVGVGEVGLDYFEKNIDKELQRKTFLKQLEIADKFKCPVIIHLRKGFEDFLQIVSDFKNLTYIMHMFSGSKEFAEKLQSDFENMYFSFGAPHIRENNKKVGQVLEMIDVEKLLIETDSPDLEPKGFAKPNTPANLVFIGEKLAKLLKMEVKELAKITTKNGKEAFKWKTIWKD